jgi:hypothetical protein
VGKRKKRFVPDFSKILRRSGIEPEAKPWKGFMLPLHQRRAGRVLKDKKTFDTLDLSFVVFVAMGAFRKEEIKLRKFLAR